MRTTNIGNDGGMCTWLRHEKYHTFAGFVWAVQNYISWRQNGCYLDDPEPSSSESSMNIFYSTIPAIGLNTLDIFRGWVNIADWEPKAERWPDSTGRYWVDITYKDHNGYRNTDFYYRQIGQFVDDKGNTCWRYVVGYKDGSELTGFYKKPYYGEGFPTESGAYWYDFEFNDKDCPQVRAWMESKDLNYLRRIREEYPNDFKRELAELQSENSEHPALRQLAEEAGLNSSIELASLDPVLFFKQPKASVPDSIITTNGMSIDVSMTS